MTNIGRKNLVTAIAVAFLLLATLDGWPYGFFTILRFVVCVSAVYLAWLAHQNEQEAWTWTFGILAVAFNPIVPIYLQRSMWVVIDLAVGLLLLISLLGFKISRENGK